MTLFPYWTGACQLSPFDSHILPRCIRESYVNWQNDILIKLIPQIQTVFQYAWTLEETIGFHDLLWSNFLFYVNMSGIHAYTLWKHLMHFKHHTRKVLYTRISEGYTDYIKQNNWQHAQQNTYLLMSCRKQRQTSKNKALHPEVHVFKTTSPQKTTAFRARLCQSAAALTVTQAARAAGHLVPWPWASLRPLSQGLSVLWAKSAVAQVSGEPLSVSWRKCLYNSQGTRRGGPRGSRKAFEQLMQRAWGRRFLETLDLGPVFLLLLKSIITWYQKWFWNVLE